MSRPSNKAYRDNYDRIFIRDPEPIVCSQCGGKSWNTTAYHKPGCSTGKGGRKTVVVDEIVGTNAYIGGGLQPKQEGTPYVVRPKRGDFCR